MAEHRVEINDGVTELANLVHLLVEQRHGHGERVAGEVVDLVVHEDAEAAVAVAVRADCRRGLADRPVNRVLQHLLDPFRAHRRPSLVVTTYAGDPLHHGPQTPGEVLR